jgi:hypothetical protein
MQHHHPLARTTHTVEMAQIDDLNQRLARRSPERPIMAADLDLAGAPLLREVDFLHDWEGVVAETGATLPVDAKLIEIGWEGPPEFPYLHGRFQSGISGEDDLLVDLHTHALRLLAGLLNVHQIWGAGRPTPD